MSNPLPRIRLPLGKAVVESCIQQPYTGLRLRGDVMAGVTVGIGAIPLSMALAMAIGLPPQHGLYTAMIAGLVCALLGGSRLSISGPTAAFVVILQPIVQSYGVSGLYLATFVSGILLVIMAFARFGRMISYIPSSVTLGFTLGIAIIIVTQQITDILGLPPVESSSTFYGLKVWQLLQQVPNTYWPAVVISVVTFVVMALWPRLNTFVPAHLPALLLASLVAVLLARLNYPVDTIATHFSYTTEAGSLRAGIPPWLPAFDSDWLLRPSLWPSAGELIPAALTVALLGAIQALLCAVMLDKMAHQRHQPNAELLGQGVGNMLAPFWGGFAASAALARSTTNYRAGASSPLSSVFHTLVIAACLLWFTDWLGYVPMAAIAVLLVMVARNMLGQYSLGSLIKKSPPSDLVVFALCVILTVLVDMITAVMAGVVLAALLFMRDIARMTHVVDISRQPKHVPEPVPETWGVYKISGPLFFAASTHVFVELREHCADKHGMVLCFDSVSLLDAGGLEALQEFMQWCRERHKNLLIADIPFQPLRTLVKAGIEAEPGVLTLYPTLAEALETLSNREP